MNTVIYNQKGEQVGKIELPPKVFNVKWNDALVHQVVTSMTGNLRNPTAHAKTRGEVSGTGKKPWKQKGTGRARHGSRRSPLWVGGGVAHGPRNERDFSRKINKKMKTKALFAVLSRKNAEHEILFIDNLSLPGPKTKEAKNILTSLSKINGYERLNNRKNVAYLALEGRSALVEKSFKNFSNLEVGEVKNLNPLNVLQYKYLIIENPEKSVALLSSRIS